MSMSMNNTPDLCLEEGILETAGRQLSNVRGVEAALENLTARLLGASKTEAVGGPTSSTPDGQVANLDTAIMAHGAAISRCMSMIGRLSDAL